MGLINTSWLFQTLLHVYVQNSMRLNHHGRSYLLTNGIHGLICFKTLLGCLNTMTWCSVILKKEVQLK
ncbi:hypothetical protein RIF29_38546 [Crotalaria pallida]|uniref:Uncharacterized protein n=1 Tax=Crotalaria pallida TaxID=3830 RepID=A0AAN9HLM6_CROPI